MNEFKVNEKIVEFRRAKISQFESNVLQDLEKLAKKKFSNKHDFITTITSDMCFAKENKEVTEIIIFSCGLSILPESIGNLRSLKKLKLVDNELKELPESIGNLTSLEELYLIGNPLKILPESIGNMTSLRELHLDWEKITHFPKSMRQLKIPEKLFIPDKQIFNLPESISNLSSLKYLFLSGNNLKTLPNSIENLKSLQELYLGNNQFLIFPKAIFTLNSLENLDLSHNKLKTIPEFIGNLTFLKRLWLGGNKLTTLPESLGNLTSLEELWLEDNKLINLPESIGKLKSLKRLSLRGNQTSSLPDSIGNLTSLQDLDLVNNPLKTLPESMGNLTAKILYPSYIDEFFNKIKQRDFYEIKNLLHSDEFIYLEREDLINLIEIIRSRESEGYSENERFEVLDILMDELQFSESGEFSFSEVAKILLVENEQEPFLDIVDTSNYPYIQRYFESDEVRRRHWQEKLYFFIFRGHVNSIELNLERLKKTAFYRNLRKLKHFSHLELVNLLCWVKYDYLLVKHELSEIKSIKLVQIYEFFNDPPTFIQMDADELKKFYDSDINRTLSKFPKFSR